MKKLGITLAMLLAAGASNAYSASIVGNWKTPDNNIVVVSNCGGQFCIRMKTGANAGKSIGRFKTSGSKYVGTLTDPRDGKKYSGSANLSGNTLRMKGCVAKVFCRTRVWKKTH